MVQKKSPNLICTWRHWSLYLFMFCFIVKISIKKKKRKEKQRCCTLEINRFHYTPLPVHNIGTFTPRSLSSVLKVATVERFHCDRIKGLRTYTAKISKTSHETNFVLFLKKTYTFSNFAKNRSYRFLEELRAAKPPQRSSTDKEN